MRPRLEALLATAVFVLSGCGHTLREDGALTSVPYDLDSGGRIIVDVRLDEQGPFRFALDTAATVSLVTAELREKLQLSSVSGRSVTVHGLVASGQFPLLQADRVDVGEVAWIDAEIVPIPGETYATASIDGVLGMDFLRQYAVVVSTQARIVRLYSSELVRHRSYRGWASIPLEPRHVGESSRPLYFLDIEIAGRTLPALFDIGSGQNIVNSPAARFLRIIPLSLEGFVMLTGPLAGARVTTRFDSDQVATQGIHWRNTAFLVADLEVFSTLNYEDEPLAILGSGMFNERDFVIDFARNRLLVRVYMP